MLTDSLTSKAADTLAALNAAITTAQNQLNQDTTNLAALQQDPNMLSVYQGWQYISKNYGSARVNSTFGWSTNDQTLQAEPDGSTLYHPWIDSNGKVYADGSSDASYQSALKQVTVWQNNIAKLTAAIPQDKVALATAQQAVSDFMNTPAGQSLAQGESTAIAANAQTGLSQAETAQVQANAAAATKTFYVKAGLITLAVGATILIIWFIHREFVKKAA